MSLLQQLSQLLSQPPGTIIYHLVTLLALQVILAVAWGQWRRNRADGVARRMAIAAGAIWLLRLFLLVVGLVGQRSAASWLLPPLTDVAQSLTAVFLLWALSTQSSRWPRPSDTVLGISAIFIVVITLFFAQTWRTLATQSVPYEESQQALFWLLFQIIIYATGLFLTFIEAQALRSLRPFIFALLFIVNMVQLALPPSEALFAWQRLADLIAFPLWAALVYRHVLVPLLVTEATSSAISDQLAALLRQATRVASTSFDAQSMAQEAIQLIEQQMELYFVAIALLADEDLQVTSNRPQSHEDRPQSWLLTLRHWPALRTAVDNQQRIELQPNGLGARQLHQLYEEFGLPTTILSPMLVEPLTVDKAVLGLLLVAHPVDWSEADSTIIQALADYLAQLLANGRRHHQAIKQAIEAIEVTITNPPPVGTGRIIALEADNKRLQEEAQLAWDRLYQEEQRAALAQQQARDLAATIEESQHTHQQDGLAALQAEIESLQQALLQAKADGSPNTEWVQAITRYSGELEEAQSRIHYLEMELRNRHDDSPRYDLLASLAEELRTPLTSIAGYTDLLLGGSVGNLAETQRSFLQRVRANTERLSTLLEQMIQLAVMGDATPVLPDSEPLDVRELIESAVHTVITLLQDKNLRLDMDIPDKLEPLTMNREALQQILANLLNNACQSSRRNGRISIIVRAETLPFAAYELPVHFIHMAITDSGNGIRPADQAHVFETHLQTDGPLIEGLGDTAAGLAVARTLTQTYGGRIWLDSEVGRGSTFSLIFPLGVERK